jgi:hypothetical protein
MTKEKDQRHLLSPLQGLIIPSINYWGSQLRPWVSHNRNISSDISSITYPHWVALSRCGIQTRLRDWRSWMVLDYSATSFAVSFRLVLPLKPVLFVEKNALMGVFLAAYNFKRIVAECPCLTVASPVMDLSSPSPESYLPRLSTVVPWLCVLLISIYNMQGSSAALFPIHWCYFRILVNAEY